MSLCVQLLSVDETQSFGHSRGQPLASADEVFLRFSKNQGRDYSALGL